MSLAAPIGLGLGALGSIVGIGEQRSQRKDARKRYNELLQFVRPELQTGMSQSERLIQNIIQGYFPSAGNRGNDALMQSLRIDPSRQLMSIAATGDPFNTSEFFAALEPLEQRATARSVAELHAGAGSLGRRFSPALFNAEADLRAQLGEQAAARRSQIAQQSHEAAQGRRLAASDQLLQGLGIDRQFLSSLLGQFAGAEQGRRGINASLLSLLAGTPLPQSGGIGSGFMDLGQLALLFGTLKKK